eukprot:8549944-Alexandrium_andersonii.AAC.1
MRAGTAALNGAAKQAVRAVCHVSGLSLWAPRSRPRRGNSGCPTSMLVTSRCNQGFLGGVMGGSWEVPGGGSL